MAENKTLAYPWPRIYCDNCGKTQPLLFSYMHDEQNDHDAADLQCEECYLVIATLYDTPRETPA